MLTFDSEIHEYKWNGVVVPSVTQILEAQGIIDYSFLPPSTREMALERGSMVHQYTQYDDEADLDDDLVDPVIAPYLAAWRKYRRETSFEPDRIEFRGYDPIWRYAGTLDRTGLARKTRRKLVDIKTNTAPAWVRMQLAGYAAFLPDPKTYERECVELHKDETYRVIPFSVKEFDRDLNDFRSVVRAHQLAMELNGKEYRRAA